jgi:NADH dehydrogenase
MGRSLFVTGAGGYVGTRLLRRVQQEHFERVVALVRNAENLAPDLVERADLEIVVGDLLEPATYADRLEDCDTVIHFAAATGKADAAEYTRVNVEGTRELLECCRSVGVRDFVHISTIAVRFANQSGYHYASSKAEAESVVSRSGLRHVILRPTMVLGPGAPVLEGLARLARLPVMPVFGSGSVHVQPIGAEDLAEIVLNVLEEDRFEGDVIEVGGPEALTIEELLARIRRVRYGRVPRAFHLPLRPIRQLLLYLEPFLLRLLPLTAGQLSSFANDSTVEVTPFLRTRWDSMASLDDMLTDLPKMGSAALSREACALGNYLVGHPPDPYVIGKYCDLHVQRAEVRTSSTFDRLLIAIAQRGRLLAALTDSYTRVFCPRSALRAKLVALLGLLECAPLSFEAFDAPYRGGIVRVYAKLVLRGALEVVLLVAGVLLLGPLHAAAALTGRTRQSA